MEALPLLGGCAAAFLVSRLVMRHSIMTEKIARRGVRVGVEYVLDFLDQVLVREVMSNPPVTLEAGQSLSEAQRFLMEGRGATHQGFPVVDRQGYLVGVTTRKEILGSALPGERPIADVIRRAPAVIYEDNSLREAADQMVHEEVGRLPVITRGERPRPVGMLTRSDLLMAHRKRLRGAHSA